MNHWRGLLRWVPEALDQNQKPRFCLPSAIKERVKSSAYMQLRDLYHQNNHVRIIADSLVRKSAESPSKHKRSIRNASRILVAFWSAVVASQVGVACFNRRLSLDWCCERNIRRWCQSRIGAVVIRRLYAQIVWHLSAWHPRWACLIQSTMHMRVNHLPAPNGPVSSSHQRQRLSITCLGLASPSFFFPVPKV